MESFKDVSLQHDPRWTAEAFANVLDNAVKYSPEKSRIQIRVEREVSYVLIEIEDEGIGIPKEEYSNIFKRFYRARLRKWRPWRGQASACIWYARSWKRREAACAPPFPQGRNHIPDDAAKKEVFSRITKLLFYLICSCKTPLVG